MPRPAKRKTSAFAAIDRPGNKRRAREHFVPTSARVPPAELSTLPEEVLLEILDYFLETIYSTDQVRALYNLCLTSRQLYRLSKPYLYSYVDNRLIEPRKLLRTLLQEPHMTEQVRNLQWFDDHGNIIPCWKRHDKKYALTHIERRELCKRVDEFGLGNPRVYARAFQLQRPKDHLAALLLLCPNVRSIDVCDTNVCCYPRGYHVTPPWLRILGAVGIGITKVPSQHFQQLSAIRIRMGPIQLRFIPPLLNLPLLRTLMLEDVYQPDTDAIIQLIWDDWVGPRSSSIENLYVENSYIDSKSLAQLVGSIRALRLFCFEFDNSVRNGAYTLYDDEFPELHYPSIAKAVLEHKDSLQQLCISDITDPELNEIFNMDPGSLGSLRDLHKVRIMDVDLECFGGVDIDFDIETNGNEDGKFTTVIRPANLAENLPPSLERLDLTLNEECDDMYEAFWVDCLAELAKTIKTSLPVLKEVRVSRKDLGGIWRRLEPELDQVSQLFVNADVKLVIPSWWPDTHMRDPTSRLLGTPYPPTDADTVE
jgi:hypothetical protein